MNYTLITGASGGIGQATARLTATQGRTPLCVGRSLATLEKSLPDFSLLQADVTRESDIRDLFAQLETRDQIPDALIHCVGSSLAAPFERISTQQYMETVSINLTSAIGVCQQFVSLLRRHKKSGSVVLFSSVVARIGVANHEVIAAAKAGIEGFALSAAASYASSGIRFNVIAPGLTETPMTRHLLSSDLTRAAAEKQYPIPGVNSATDIAGLACWLSSTEAARVTAQIIAVDGGFSRIRPLVRAQPFDAQGRSAIDSFCHIQNIDNTTDAVLS